MIEAASKFDPIDVPSKFGKTVRDAELALRKAKYCFIYVRSGPDVRDASLFGISKGALRDELKRHRANEKLPFEIDFNADHGPVLTIGGMDAVEAAVKETP